MVVLRQIFYLGISSSLLYALLVVAAMLIYPPILDGTMDTLSIHNRAGKIFTNSPRYLVWNRSSLDRPTSKIILIGSSNLRAALNLDTLQTKLPAIDVHNLSVGGMNITQMTQIVDLALEIIPKEALPATNFVAALSFALFVENDHRWRVYEKLPGSRVEMEMRRFGLYRRTAEGLGPIVPPRSISALALGLWPLLAISSARHQVRKFWRSNIDEEDASVPDMRQTEQRDKAMRMWQAYVGRPDQRLAPEQFDELVKLSRKIRGSGAKLTILDMPLPRWFVSTSPYDADYQLKKRRYFPQALVGPDASLIDLRNMDRIEDYRDSGHLNRRAGDRFSERLADHLAKMTGQ